MAEATIDDIRTAFSKNEVTCSELVQLYLDRIIEYDHVRVRARDCTGGHSISDRHHWCSHAVQKGPFINAMISINPNLTSDAAALEQMSAADRAEKPLWCIPFVGMYTPGRRIVLRGSAGRAGGSQFTAECHPLS